MNLSLNLWRAKNRFADSVIVFEPVTVRTGIAWRALALVQTALLVWGGVSLAGVAVGAIVYARGEVPPAATKPPQAKTEIAALAAPQGLLPGQPAPAGARIIQVKSIVPVKAATVKASAKPVPVLRSDVPSPPVQDLAKPVMAARLPQARPSEPLITGSIGPQEDEAAPRRRFRRLRDVRLRFPHAPGAPLRMPPPLRETDPVGRHIRQVWAEFPLRPQRRDPAGSEAWAAR